MSDTRVNLVAPVWWDPKARVLAFDHTTFVAAVLVVSDDRVVLATPQETILTAKFRDIRATFIKLALTGACDLEALGQTYRLYFSPPFLEVPRLSDSDLEKVGLKIHEAENFASHHFDDIAQLGDTAIFLGSALRATAAYSEEKRGRQNAHVLQQLLPSESVREQVYFTPRGRMRE